MDRTEIAHVQAVATYAEIAAATALLRRDATTWLADYDDGSLSFYDSVQGRALTALESGDVTHPDLVARIHGYAARAQREFGKTG